MSTYALPSGTYRAASIKQVWIGLFQARAQRFWQALELFGRRRAQARMAETARHLEMIRPELAGVLRQAMADLDRQG